MKKLESAIIGSVAVAVGYKLGCKLYQYFKAKQETNEDLENAEKSESVMENNH